jgi:tetratricopeptide (TPR) repeat protein
MDRGGLIREAIDEYARILKLDPRNAFAHKKHAALVREREKIDQLTDRYLGYVIKRMEKIDDHFREGMKLYLDGCFEEALGEFVAGTAEAPTPEAYYGEGACLVRMGSLIEAVPRFREAIKLNPEFKEAHTMLGILYERYGLLYEAYEEYERGLKEARDRIRSLEERQSTVDPREKSINQKFFQLD